MRVIAREKRRKEGIKEERKESLLFFNFQELVELCVTRIGQTLQPLKFQTSTKKIELLICVKWPHSLHILLLLSFWCFLETNSRKIGD